MTGEAGYGGKAMAALGRMYMIAGAAFACRAEEQSEWRCHGCFSLLLLAGGQAVCADGNGGEHRLARGDCLLLPPAAAASELRSDGEATGFRISFAFSAGAAGEPEPELPLGKIIRVNPVARLCDEAAALCRENTIEADSRWSAFQRHIAFQQLVCRVLEQSGPDDEPATHSVAAVQRSIAHLRERYADGHSVRQLARSANLGVRQYTRLFKRLTGLTPIAYLHEYRINRSREMLLQGDDPLMRISQSIGIEDVHYFNRLFKTTVGCAPKEYVRKRNLDSRIVTMHYAGELLALGLSPLGELDSTLDQIQAQAQFGPIASIGEMEPNPELLARLRPDLIIASDFMRRELLSALKQIAPVIVVPWDIRPFERLMRIAAVLGKETAAKTWLTRYETKKRQAVQWRESRGGPQETAAILRVEPDKVWVHASRFFPTFYEVLDFRPSRLMRQWVEAPEQERRLAVAYDQLAELSADRLYLIEGRAAAYGEWLNRLLRAEGWRRLEAVRRKRVYLLRQRGISYDAGTLEWQLGQVEQLWAEPPTPGSATASGWVKPLPVVDSQ